MALHRDLESLVPVAQTRFKAFLAKLAQNDLAYFIVETLREPSVQAAYYAQGRELLAGVNALRKQAGLWPITEKQNKTTITKAKAGQSNHETGRAADIVPANEKGLPDWGSWKTDKARWEKFFTLAEECELVVGGRWKQFPDPPHYELPKGV